MSRWAMPESKRAHPPTFKNDFWVNRVLAIASLVSLKTAQAKALKWSSLPPKLLLLQPWKEEKVHQPILFPPSFTWARGAQSRTSHPHKWLTPLTPWPPDHWPTSDTPMPPFLPSFLVIVKTISTWTRNHTCDRTHACTREVDVWTVWLWLRAPISTFQIWYTVNRNLDRWKGGQFRGLGRLTCWSGPEKADTRSWYVGFLFTLLLNAFSSPVPDKSRSCHVAGLRWDWLTRWKRVESGDHGGHGPWGQSRDNGTYLDMVHVRGVHTQLWRWVTWVGL